MDENKKTNLLVILEQKGKESEEIDLEFDDTVKYYCKKKGSRRMDVLASIGYDTAELDPDPGCKNIGVQDFSRQIDMIIYSDEVIFGKDTNDLRFGIIQEICDYYKVPWTRVE